MPTTRVPTQERSSFRDSKVLALTAMLFAVSMTFIDQTIVSIAAPDIEQELGLSADGVQWIVNGYLLALAAFFALGGRVSDIAGRKRVVLGGVIVFAVSSALCGLTPQTDFAQAWITTFRVIQGAGAAFLFPAALAVVVAAFPVHERGRALAIFFAVSGGLTAIGPLAGGYLTQWTWRAIFWVNIPVAIIAVVLTLIANVDPARRRDRVDWPGAVLIAAGMGLSVLGFQQSANWGWSSPWTWGCIVAGLALLVWFAFFERGQQSPLIQMRIFRNRAFTVDNAVLFFSMMAFVPVFFFSSMYAQISLGEDASNAGLFLMWFFLGFVIAAQVGGRILDRVGSKWAVVAGCAISAAGFAIWAYRVPDLDASSQVWPIIIAGAGVGLLLGPASTDAVNRAINASYGEVTGITQTIRNYGSAIGMAVLGTLLISVTKDKMTSSLVGLGLPQAEAAEFVDSSASASGGGAPTTAGIPDALRDKIHQAVEVDFAAAVQLVFYGMALAMVLALIASVFHPGDKVEDPQAEPAAA